MNEKNNKIMSETQIRVIIQTLSRLNYKHKYGFFNIEMKKEKFIMSKLKKKNAYFILLIEISNVSP